MSLIRAHSPSAAPSVDAMSEDAPSPVRQMRLVVAVDDFDQAVGFYRDVGGMTEQAAFNGEGDARVAILLAGEATLEISNRAQVSLIDRVETDGGVSDPLRVAFEVDDADAMTRRLEQGGAAVEASPRETPWRSLNSRLRAPDGLQLTLFQELETLEERRRREGFENGAVDEVLGRERELQTPEARRDPGRVRDMLSADFVEIGASGRRWGRDEILELLASQADGVDPIDVEDLQGRMIAPGLVLAEWISTRGARRARRTSLWRREDGAWRLLHHQGTPLPAADAGADVGTRD